MSHLITKGGFAAYFPSMLSDQPRAASYDAAIGAAVREFIRTEGGRAPVVVDVGCGTGLLTWLALHHGAHRVYAADTNPAVLKLAKTALERTFGKKRVKQTVVFVIAEKDAVSEKIPKVDMIVSEILGTLVNSEMAMKYVNLYMEKRLNTFGPRVYVVPRCATQTLALHAFHGTSPALRVAVEAAVDAAWRLRTWAPTNENGLSVLLHAFPSTVLASAAVYSESYETAPPTKASMKIPVPMPRGDDTSEADLHLTVFEWEVELWTGVTPLRNTLAELRAIASTDPSSAIARDSAWGFVVVPPLWGADVLAKCIGKGLRVTAAGSVADGPPSGDFRGGEDGTVLATARYAADQDLAESLVRGMADWLTTQLADAEASATVVIYRDPTAGLVSDLAIRRLRDRVRQIFVLGSDKDALFSKVKEAYASIKANARDMSRGWAEWLAALPPPVVLLAPSRLTDPPTGTRQAPFPFSAYPTYPPALRPMRSVDRQRLFPAMAFGSVPGLAETGVLSLFRGLRRPIPFNLFPSVAYTHAMYRADVASADAGYGLGEDTDVVRMLSEDSEGEPGDEWMVPGGAEGWGVRLRVRERTCPSPDVPACTIAHLVALARRNRKIGGVFVDQLSLVARATSQRDPPTLSPF